ncbi:MAG: SDR family oxidoreductase [Cyclobacteriaceae bacterium]
MKSWNLENKKALVTGGSKGIGYAAVLQFLKLGAEVIFTARNEEEIKSVASDLQSQGFKVTGIKADVTNEEDTTRVRQLIEEKWQQLDILFNNAGVNIRKRTVDYTTEEYKHVLGINLIAQFELCRQLHPLLKASGKASVINNGSIAGQFDVTTGSPYGISKAGMIQLSKNLAVEWAPDGIRVNTVSPGFTVTPLTKPLFAKQEKIDAIIQRTPMKRVAEADEMASVISFLAMDHASFVTGQNITVDGGISASVF